MPDVLIYGTRNPSKIAQVQDALRATGLRVVGLDDTIQTTVEENGTTPEENARKKAVEYAKLTSKTVLSMDAALYFKDIDTSLQPGLYVRRIPDNTSATDDEMLTYYTRLINDHGGSLDGYWEFSFALGYPDGTSEAFISQTPRKFVGTPDSNRLPGYPLESIQIDTKSGKYVTQLSAEEQANAWRETLGSPLEDFIKKYYIDREL